MLTTVYGIFPVRVVYVEGDVKGFAGYSWGHTIKIDRDYQNDRGLLEHELEHSRQYYRSAGLWPFLYRWSAKRRLRYELDAYAVQLRFADPADRDRLAVKFAGFIARRYNLKDINAEETARTLRSML